MKRQFSIRIDDRLLKELERIAMLRDRSVGYLIREAVVALVKQAKKEGK
jgi:predicted transcriptional regulator